jgi:hypothetical protein
MKSDLMYLINTGHHMRKQKYDVWAAFDTIVTIQVLCYSRYHFESPNRNFYQKRDFIEVRKTFLSISHLFFLKKWPEVDTWCNTIK